VYAYNPSTGKTEVGGVGVGGRNDPSLVCTYENKTVKKKD
jgi:hypothetical protein